MIRVVLCMIFLVVSANVNAGIIVNLSSEPSASYSLGSGDMKLSFAGDALSSSDNKEAVKQAV